MKFTEDVRDVDPTKGLIYLWEIEGEDGELYHYVGMSKHGADRPRKADTLNVRNLQAKRDYREGNPDGFREVHHELAEADKNNQSIRLIFLENFGPGENGNALKRKWQEHYGVK